ncbi:hypothetical protein NNG48_07010 [Enterococcus faecium]|nr:hypothetical protein [Enterococcus faecium]
MEAFIATCLGIFLAEVWHGQASNAENKAEKIVCNFGCYGTYVLTLVYLFSILT